MTRPSLCLPMLFVLACPCLAQQPGLKLTTSRPGNLYDYLAPVTVSVSATGLTAPEWTLIDFDRKMVASGKVSLTDGKGTISLGLLPRGYYELTCTEGPTTGAIRRWSSIRRRTSRTMTGSPSSTAATWRTTVRWCARSQSNRAAGCTTSCPTGRRRRPGRRGSSPSATWTGQASQRLMPTGSWIWTRSCRYDF